MTDRTSAQLQIVDEVNRLLSDIRIPHWLFGGWSVDFHAGNVTREHGDVDFFIWERDGPRAEELLNTAGYEPVEHPHPEEALIWRKHGQIVELYLLAVNEQGRVVVQGRWENWPLPDNALGNEIRMLKGVRCPVVSIECILDTKEGYARYTGIQPREKDQADMLTLRDSMGIT